MDAQDYKNLFPKMFGFYLNFENPRKNIVKSLNFVAVFVFY